MIEPTEDQILQKAKELCREDGKVWDSANIDRGATGKVVTIASDSDHAEYLNRAKALLSQA